MRISRNQKCNRGSERWDIVNIVLCRIDERLAHGQVITSWTRLKEVLRILVVDDALAKDSFMSEVMEMAAPTGVKVEVRATEEALAIINEEKGSQNTMLLFKDLLGAYKLIKSGYHMKELNIGNIGSGPGRKAVTKRVYMSPSEIEMAKELSEMGVYVYLQMVPSDPEVNVLTQI